MKHKSSSPHVHMLMGNHGSNSSHPESILMKGQRQHHYSGGITNSPPHFYEGGKPQPRKFAKGGHCYAEGGEAAEYGEKPLTGQLRRGGSARRKHHFAGDGVEGISSQQEMPRQEQKHGGRTKRQQHYWGQEGVGRIPVIGGIAKAISRKAGTFDENKYGGNQYKRIKSTSGPKAGAPVADNSIRQQQKSGGRSKRSHHYWGQDVIGRLPLIGGVANSIANSAGTLDANKYGGSEYVADTPGRKVADIASHIGNFAAPLMMLKKGGKAHRPRKHHAEGEDVRAGAPVADNSVRQEQKHGGRSKRKGHYWGQDFFGRLPLVGSLANGIAGTVGTLDDDQYGGANYVADTPGRKAADIISTVGNLGTNLLLSAKGGGKGKGGGAPAPKKRGGTVHHRHRAHHAEGGAGKVRKGMMTNSGHMIHNER